MSKKKELSDIKCCFCGLAEDNEVKYGKIHTYKDIVTHYYCLLLSSNMEQKGRDNEGILGFLLEDIHKELRRGRKLVCTHCKKSGATLGCCNTKCKKIFHFPCGLRAGALHQFYGEFKSFCAHHRSKQKVDNIVMQEIKNLNEVLCCICYDQVKPEDSTFTLWASCCKKAWFHKECVQQLAISAGYFFKCPLCNNKKDFQQEMLENGIFIPHQDASWELVPHAFQELLYRHDSCDAEDCLCPKGRNHRSNNAKWELVLCRTCGSQGIHMACGQLKWGNRSVWDCKECRIILNKPNESTSSTIVHIRHNISDASSDDSDSDVSVGVEFPMPCSTSEPPRPTVSTTPINLPPGPKSYKIRQLLSQELRKTTETHHTPKCDKSNEVDEDQSQSSMLKSQLFDGEHSSCAASAEVLAHNKSSPSSSKSNVITIDSDDEIVEIVEESKDTSNRSLEIKNSLTSSYTSETTEQSMLDKTFISSDTHNVHVDDEIVDCGSPTPICNIRISNVTSLSESLFRNEPDINSDITDSGDGYNSISSNINNSEIPLKRKSSIHLTSPGGNRVKRIRSDEFNRASDDLIDSPCSGSQSLPPTFAPHSYSPTSSQTLKEIDVEEVYEDQGSRSGSYRGTDDTTGTTEAAYSSASAPFSAGSFLDAVLNSKTSSSFFASRANDEDYIENPLEETFCEMNPLVMEADEGSVINCPSMIPSGNRTVIKRKSNGHESTKNNISDCTAGNHINSQHIDELRNSVTQKHLLSMDINDISNCHKDADTSLVAESDNASCNDNASSIIRADESSRRLQNSPPPEHWGHSSEETSAGAWSSDDNEDSFSTVATNYTACDHLRLIPETIRLQDLKFRVCSANVLKMVLYDTFSVNISMEQKTESDSYKESATRMKLSKSRESSMEADNRNINNSSEYVDTSDEKSSCVDNAEVRMKCKEDVRMKDDTKENFNPIATSLKKSVVSCVGNNCLPEKEINLFKRVISPLSTYDVSEEENYDKSWQNKRKFTSPIPEFKLNPDGVQSVHRTLRSSSKDYCPTVKDSPSAQQDVDERVPSTCFNVTPVTRTVREKPLRRSVSEKYRSYNNRNSDYETSETVNELSKPSKEKVIPQNRHLTSLKVSIDLNKIRNVINECIPHRIPRRTSLRNGDLRRILAIKEQRLESENYSSSNSQMGEESDDSKLDQVRSLTPVTTSGHSLRRSNRHFEKHCLFDR